MATSITNTGITFPDATIQTTAATGGGGYALNAYTSPATWTKPAGLNSVKVTVVGGGGGGGGSARGASGGHGGGGGVAILYIPALSIPGPVSVTSGAGGSAGPTYPLAPGAAASTSGGAGGTSSFGAFVTATGGAGAVGQPGPTGSPGSGGTGSSGDVNTSGGRSKSIARSAGENGNIFSVPTQGPVTGTGNGLTGAPFGGGGTGALPAYASTSTGGAGAPGIVIVEEFY